MLTSIVPENVVFDRDEVLRILYAGIVESLLNVHIEPRIDCASELGNFCTFTLGVSPIGHLAGDDDTLVQRIHDAFEVFDGCVLRKLLNGSNCLVSARDWPIGDFDVLLRWSEPDFEQSDHSECPERSSCGAEEIRAFALGCKHNFAICKHDLDLADGVLKQPMSEGTALSGASSEAA